MAIATLEECFDNARVFTGVVKIRKGMAARLILACGSIAPVEAWFYSFARRMESRCPADDPSRAKLLAATATIVDLTAESARRLAWQQLFVWFITTGLAAAVACQILY